jgi:hypothetical protein
LVLDGISSLGVPLRDVPASYQHEAVGAGDGARRYARVDDVAALLQALGDSGVTFKELRDEAVAAGSGGGDWDPDGGDDNGLPLRDDAPAPRATAPRRAATAAGMVQMAGQVADRALCHDGHKAALLRPRHPCGMCGSRPSDTLCLCRHQDGELLCAECDEKWHVGVRCRGRFILENRGVLGFVLRKLGPNHFIERRLEAPRDRGDDADDAITTGADVGAGRAACPLRATAADNDHDMAQGTSRAGAVPAAASSSRHPTPADVVFKGVCFAAVLAAGAVWLLWAARP